MSRERLWIFAKIIASNSLKTSNIIEIFNISINDYIKYYYFIRKYGILDMAEICLSQNIEV